MQLHGNSGQFVCHTVQRVVDTVSHSLRIKEDSYNNMFVNKDKALAEAKVILEQAQKLHDEAEEIKTKEAKNVDTIRKLVLERES